MMMGELEFEEAEGLAAEFIHDGIFDIEGFQAKWHERKLHQQLQDIAARCMGMTDLDDHPELKTALAEAYHLGCSKRA